MCPKMAIEMVTCIWLQLEGLEDELKCMHETGAGGFYKPLPLPEGMALSSSDVIASLNEHLIVALQVLFFISLCDKIAFIARIKRDESLDVHRFVHCWLFACPCQQDFWLFMKYVEWIWFYTIEQLIQFKQWSPTAEILRPFHFCSD